VNLKIENISNMKANQVKEMCDKELLNVPTEKNDESNTTAECSICNTQQVMQQNRTLT